MTSARDVEQTLCQCHLSSGMQFCILIIDPNGVYDLGKLNDQILYYSQNKIYICKKNYIIYTPC